MQHVKQANAFVGFRTGQREPDGQPVQGAQHT